MNVLVLSHDPAFFAPGEQSDTRKRHELYAAELCRKYSTPVKLVVLVGQTTKKKFRQSPIRNSHLEVFSTNSICRWFHMGGMLLKFLKIKKYWRPDLITTQNLWDEGLLGLGLSRWTGAKFLPQLHFDLFSQAWLNESSLNPIKHLVARWVAKRAHGVRVVSSILKEKVVTQWGIPQQKVHIIPVGSELKLVNDKGHDIDGPMVLFVGRFCAQKNLPLWIQVAFEVKEKFPLVQFVMVGDGELRAQIQELTKQSSHSASFHFLGFQERTALAGLYRKASLLLLTSDYEGFGRVVVESMMFGVPVVATCSSGPEDIISHGVDGFLCSVGDKNSLVQSVLKLLQDPDLVERMGNLGNEKVRREFSQERLVKKLVQCWTQVAMEQ